MWINHHKKLLFFHVPKTGGHAIQLSLLDNKNFKDDPKGYEKWQVVLGMHGSFSDFKERLPELYENVKDNYYKFNFVRNPWSHALSFYFHDIDVDRFFTQYGNDFNPKDFNDFKWWLETKYKSQSYYTFNNELYHYDEIFKYEEIKEVWPIIAEKCDYVQRDLYYYPSVMNKNKENVLGLEYPEDYRTFYDDETKEIVRQKGLKEIEMFNYEF